jgi:hypothetical protein
MKWGKGAFLLVTLGAAHVTAQAPQRTATVRISGAVPEYHSVHRGDTLWDITGYYFANPWDWPRVWAMNPEIANPHWIYPDDRVRLREVPNAAATARVPGLRGAGARGPRPAAGAVWLRNMGYLDENALEQAGTIAGSPEERMLLTQYDEVYVSFEDEDHVPAAGTELTIYREIPEEERNEQEEGQLVRIQGAVVLREWDRDRHVARAEITEAFEPIERGFRVARMARHIETVEPRVNDRDVTARVVATTVAREMLAEHQVIFVDAGETQGVRVGNRFQIVRADDPYRSTHVRHVSNGDMVPNAATPDEYPPEIIAEGRVVDVRRETCTLLITQSISEVHYGDRAEMRNGF